MFKKIICLTVIALLSNSSWSELRDPTQPKYPINSQPTTTVVEDEPKLSAIWISATSKRATINGFQAKQGQTIMGNIRVLNIHKNSVTISRNGRIKTLELIHRPYETH